MFKYPPISRNYYNVTSSDGSRFVNTWLPGRWTPPFKACRRSSSDIKSVFAYFLTASVWSNESAEVHELEVEQFRSLVLGDGEYNKGLFLINKQFRLLAPSTFHNRPVHTRRPDVDGSRARGQMRGPSGAITRVPRAEHQVISDSSANALTYSRWNSEKVQRIFNSALKEEKRGKKWGGGGVQIGKTQ